MKLEITSESGKVYNIDTEQVTCTCPNFRYRCGRYPIDSEHRLCKHISKVFTEHPELKPIQLIRAEKAQEPQVKKSADGKIRYPRSLFDPYVKLIRDTMNDFPEIIQYEICGSYRRQCKEVSDLDVLFTMKDGCTVDGLFNYVENYLGYIRQWRGDLKAGYLSDGFVHIDFKLVPKESWVYALLHFTGSKYENVALRRRAISMGYKLNEYGLFNKDGNPIKDLVTEQDVYEFLKLPYKYPWQR